MIARKFPVVLIFVFLLAACSKESKLKRDGFIELKAKVVCGDCFYTIQKGSKPIISKTKGAYNEETLLTVKKGDTILFAGWNYSLSQNMDGFLFRDAKEIRHGTTHCGGNPTFFMEYIVD